MVHASHQPFHLAEVTPSYSEAQIHHEASSKFSADALNRSFTCIIRAVAALGAIMRGCVLFLHNTPLFNLFKRRLLATVNI